MSERFILELVFEYHSISRQLVIHPPSIFTYGIYLRRGCDFLFSRLIISLVWLMMSERFVAWFEI